MLAGASLAADTAWRDVVVQLVTQNGTATDLVRTWGKERTIGALVMLVDDPDPKLQTWGLQQLGELSPAQAREKALERIKIPGGREETLQAALDVLAARRNPEDIEQVLLLLNPNCSLPLRLAAIRTLGQLGPSSAGRLVALLQSASDPRVRAAAAHALGVQAVPAPATSLAHALEADRNVLVRSEAAWALGEVGGEVAFAALAGQIRGERPPDAAIIAAIHAIGHFRSTAIEVLGVALGKTRDETILRAICQQLVPSTETSLPKYATKENSPPAAHGFCVQFMRHPEDALLRGDLLGGMLYYTGMLRLPPASVDDHAREAENCLVTAIIDKKRDIRATAYSALPERMGERAQPLIQNGLRDKDFLVRIGAAVGLAELGKAARIEAATAIGFEWSQLEVNDLRRSLILSAAKSLRGDLVLLEPLAGDALRTTISFPIISEAAGLIAKLKPEQVSSATRAAIRANIANPDEHVQRVAKDLEERLTHGPELKSSPSEKRE
jgi:HEAT repeat protein